MVNGPTGYGASSGKFSKSDGTIINAADIINAMLNNSFAKNGGLYIDDTVLKTPPTNYNFIAIQALEEAVIESITGNVNLNGATLPQNFVVFGVFSEIILSSG